MLRVELIYDSECPNVGAARQALIEAFAHAGLSPSWVEWDRGAADSPPHIREFGSPTILVEGRDISGDAPFLGTESCRVYDHGTNGLSGIPPVDRIALALADSAVGGAMPLASRGTFHRWGFLAALPSVGTAFLPVGTCPACWPAYAGVLGSMGLWPLLGSKYLLPLISSFLALSLFGLAYGARTRRGFAPFALGLVASLVVLAFKFAYPVDALVYVGIAALVAASVWNAWPLGNGDPAACRACTDTTNAAPIHKEKRK